MEKLQLLSIAIELIIGILAIITALRGPKYMFGLAFTFFVYVIYDLSKLYAISTLNSYAPVLFFLATLSALWSIYSIYKLNQ